MKLTINFKLFTKNCYIFNSKISTINENKIFGYFVKTESEIMPLAMFTLI